MALHLDNLRATTSGENLPFGSIAEQTTLPMMVLDRDLNIVFANKAYQGVAEQTEEALLGRNIVEVIAGAGKLRQEVEERCHQTFAGKVTFLDVWPYQSARKGNGEVRKHWQAVQEPLRNSEGEVVYILHRAQDVTEQVLLQRSNDVVTAELDHRVKNFMTVILATVRLSSVGADSVEQYTEDLCGRLDSMSRNYGMLSARDWQGLTLREIFEDELAHAGSRYAHRHTIKGEDFPLSLKASKDGCMIIHELVANAVKHGCFSKSDGWLDIEWSIQGDDLRVIWSETGVSGVSEPQKAGFGSKLLQMMPNARITREFRETGLLLEYLVPVHLAFEAGA